MEGGKGRGADFHDNQVLVLPPHAHQNITAHPPAVRGSMPQYAGPAGSHSTPPTMGGTVTDLEIGNLCVCVGGC
jgi:hypothetical protein